MAKVSVEDMQRNLSTYLERVEAGETLVILRDGQPVAEMRATVADSADLRPFGLCAGQFIVPDDFDDPLPEYLLEDFQGH